MPPTNTAAWLPAKSVKPLQVGPAPYTAPGADEIVIKNGAVAINPVDWAKQLIGDAILGHIRYPFVLGGDVAGEVVEVGSAVQRLRVGDRVCGLAAGSSVESNKASEGAFQQYTVVREYFAAVIPNDVSYERACVLPLCLCTAAYGLFHKDFLALNPPTLSSPFEGTEKRKAVIITGGSSSVGCNAVQLAVAAGYQVYSTSSPKNFAYVEKLGATRVFDYHSDSMVSDMIDELQGKDLVGALAVGDGSVEACIKVLRRSCADKEKRKLAFAGFPLPVQKLNSMLGMAGFVASFAWWTGETAVKSRLAGVNMRWIDTKELIRPDNVVSRLVFHDFLSRALEPGQFVPAPEPLIVGKGLDKIQEALDTQMKGVSAQKVVVSL